ncbi:hypothetical protein [Pseudomarimonas salicorniae]|uniref:Uncharacterized protein n=1 Tax=Pseudomarimonas salicorniae TaxID=2933270 RepID=A0ABT0GEF0_9GAMM|nr:hypothetical protein [Lysobacter sp. CAU 1642]MCK7592929.1 hypothetical protein [Lysobacter sp. CAU 1642]
MSTDQPTAPPATSARSTTPAVSELLALGYVYLLILGIANQSLFYGLLGVNFLAWSDALDVLISPIALLTERPGRLAVLVLLVALLYPYTMWIQRLARKRRLAQGGEQALRKDTPLVNAWLAYSACVLVFGYIGFAAGSGSEVRKRLAEGKAEVDHRIEFQDGSVIEAELVGKNTGFLFYFIPGETELSIVPLADNVRRVQRRGAADPAAEVRESADERKPVAPSE